MIESVSRRAFGSSSGTYNVRASELARERKLNIFNVTVHFLDDTQQSFQIEKKAKGSVLLELVFQHLELVEKDYFGLQFTENGSPPSATNIEITRWLDSSKSVKKQVGANAQFWLAVRFYPPEPSRLSEEFTRYLLCLQLRKLLLDGRMTAPKNTALLLASFTVQAELGDYAAAAAEGGAGYASYAAALRLVARAAADDERRVRELHKLHRGQAPADADANFLEHAKRLDCYGVDSHPAKDYNGKDIFIGVTSIGIVVFQNNIRVNTFSWSKIVKISFKKKQFFIQLKREPSESYDTVLGFNMRSGRAAKALWRCSVERHGFFRLRAPRRDRCWERWARWPGWRRRVSRAPRRKRLRPLGATAPPTGPSRSSSRTRERSVGASTGSNVCVTSSPALTVNGARGSRVTHDEPPPRPAWGDAPPPDEESGGFLERALRVPLSYADESESSESAECGGEVPVRLAAGADGRFGFNVRGGGGAPVLVSRVAPRARSTLQEGDQVISINDHDVEEMTHDEIVQLIRNTKGVLTLVVRPNAVYSAEESAGSEEPAVCFVPLGGAGGAGGEVVGGRRGRGRAGAVAAAAGRRAGVRRRAASVRRAAAPPRPAHHCCATRVQRRQEPLQGHRALRLDASDT
ncbi:unnamed protein product [Parnassius apollo]|uniref:(apollo) hypothetical protein n=1 Tax=Parnassius apollo TaxID=110799 RepID=A0A8S3W4T9_PARAO|nr:unnamed protein product [Parnassius apollo]